MEPESNSPPEAPQVPQSVASFDLRAPDEPPPWSGWDVALIVVVAFFGFLLLSTLAFAVAAHVGAFRGMKAAALAQQPAFIIPVQFASYAVIVVFMYLLVGRSYHRPFWRTLRWKWPERAWMFPVCGVALALGIQFGSVLLPIPKSLPIEGFFKDRAGAWLMTAFGISAAPLVEELFFRGFLYPVLLRRIGNAAAIVLTAAGFALIHESQLGHAWGPVLLVFIVGLVLTIIRARTGSVAASFLVHCSYNLTLFVLLFIATDRFQHMERAAMDCVKTAIGLWQLAIG